MSRKPRLIVLPPQHLGHEIHVGRSIVCDMLKRGYLSPGLGDSIITGLPDRKFLYEGLFGIDGVMDFSQMIQFPAPIRPPKAINEYFTIASKDLQATSQFRNFDIINLDGYALPPTYCTFTTSNEMKQIGYEVPQRYFDEDFKSVAKVFNFCSKEEVLQVVPPSIENFMIIHDRYDAPLVNLTSILSKFSKLSAKVIFTANSQRVPESLRVSENLIIVDNLKLYASLLKDSRCTGLISEWSGAGQLSQYTLGPQGLAIYYHGHYQDIYNFTASHKIYELNATLGNYFNCWDFKNISGCKIVHFRDFDELVSNMPLM
jgi:hypothetical protein